jgi:cadmium resistance protein CadD (predicted permease)
LACSLISRVIPAAYIGLLGLLPIGIGAHQLWDCADDVEPTTPTNQSRSSAATIAAITIANGGDNIGIYVPLFATHSAAQLSVICAVFLLMTGLWCALSYWLAHHPALVAPLRKLNGRVFAYVLIALGVFILWESATLPALWTLI